MMNKKTIVSLMTFAVLVAMCFPFCEVPETENEWQPNKITLIWNKSFDGQSQSDVKTGMIWTLSWLGAELPKGSFEKACAWSDSTRFTINLDSVGFNESARHALRVICDSIKRSEEYAHYDGIDVGKFVMLTLGSTWHYYEITGVPETLDEFKRKYKFDSTAHLFGVTNSGVAEGHRKIYFSRDTALFHCGFIAEEGDGSLESATFKAMMYECFDIMPNGQLRFMVYDENGNLAAGSPSAIGDAGKPTKCLWCHETHVQSLFIENQPVTGMLTNEGFMQIRDSIQSRLERYRLILATDMDWKNQRDHTLSELLYITYMEPTVMHLTNEWRMNDADVLALLKLKNHHRFEEFDYIGEVYERWQVESLDSVFNLEVPASARETAREVNYFR